MSFDIDLDFANRTDILGLIEHIPARQVVNNKVRHHVSGIYVTDIPYDPVNECASIEYKEAEQRGYFKIDFLNVGVYRLIKDQQHYTQLLQKDTPWHRLLDRSFCNQVIHINEHYDLIEKFKPNSINKMAIILALIRPSKRHLINESWDIIESQIWIKPDNNDYYFKKSHGIAYAMLVSLHIKILDEQN